MTRDPKGEKALGLKGLGIDVVEASLDDRDTLAKAVAGSHGVFLVTNYWQYMDKAREIKQGKDAADVCKQIGVQHLVYSGLELVKDITGWECPHFDTKGTVEKYLDEINLPNTSIRLSAYYQTFAMPSLYEKQKNGSFTYTTCMQGPMDGIDVDDIGHVVSGVFSNPAEYIGKKVGLAGDRLTIEQYVDIISNIKGTKINVARVPAEVYAKFPFPGADDIAAMFHFYDNGNPVRDQKLTKMLNPNAKLFQQWVKSNKKSFSFFDN